MNGRNAIEDVGAAIFYFTFWCVALASGASLGYLVWILR